MNSHNTLIINNIYAIKEKMTYKRRSCYFSNFPIDVAK